MATSNPIDLTHARQDQDAGSDRRKPLPLDPDKVAQARITAADVSAIGELLSSHGAHELQELADGTLHQVGWLLARMGKQIRQDLTPVHY